MNDDQAFWKQFIEKNEMPAAEALAQILRIETVSGHEDPEEQKAWRSRIGEGMDNLEKLGRSLGLDVRRYENRVLVIEAPAAEGAKVLGFAIHLDVVPAGEGWTHDPFGGEIADGAIWGRGTQDDKGPIIEAIFALHGAMELARQSDRRLVKTVRLMIFSEEECGFWEDIPYYFERESPPDFSIVPDALFPITNGEKGMINLNVNFEWEPTLEGLFKLSSGERPNVVPALATLAVGDLLLDGLTQPEGLGEDLITAPRKPEVNRVDGGIEIQFHGTGAHGSEPQSGYNAAADALAVAAQLPAMRQSPSGRALAWLAQAAGDCTGEFLGIDHEDPKVGATTVNLGVLRADEHSVHAILNIRNPIGLTCSEVQDRVRHAAGKLGRFTSGLTRNEVGSDLDFREPIYVDPAQFPEWIDPMRRAYEAVTGREAHLETMGGTTFAKAFPNAVCFGPTDYAEDKALEHQADEHVTLKAFSRNIEIYGRAIMGIAF